LDRPGLAEVAAAFVARYAEARYLEHPTAWTEFMSPANGPSVFEWFKVAEEVEGCQRFYEDALSSNIMIMMFPMDLHHAVS